MTGDPALVFVAGRAVGGAVAVGLEAGAEAYVGGGFAADVARAAVCGEEVGAAWMRVVLVGGPEASLGRRENTAAAGRRSAGPGVRGLLLPGRVAETGTGTGRRCIGLDVPGARLDAAEGTVARRGALVAVNKQVGTAGVVVVVDVSSLAQGWVGVVGGLGNVGVSQMVEGGMAAGGGGGGHRALVAGVAVGLPAVAPYACVDVRRALGTERAAPGALPAATDSAAARGPGGGPPGGGRSQR